jgi:hypothetical protein
LSRNTRGEELCSATVPQKHVQFCYVGDLVEGFVPLGDEHRAANKYCKYGQSSEFDERIG